jgi:hypothetical protein
MELLLLYLPWTYLQDGLQRWGHLYLWEAILLAFQKDVGFFSVKKPNALTFTGRACCQVRHLVCHSIHSQPPPSSRTCKHLWKAIRRCMIFARKLSAVRKSPGTLNSSGNRPPSTCLLMSTRLFSRQPSSIFLVNNDFVVYTRKQCR